jgi:hypothetical protein
MYLDDLERIEWTLTLPACHSASDFAKVVKDKQKIRIHIYPKKIPHPAMRGFGKTKGKRVKRVGMTGEI